MKTGFVVAVSMAMVVALVVGASVAMAAKPQNAIEMSNGMPSGDHETLLIHGKKADYQCVPCDPELEQCNVINVPEYGQATIKYVSGRKVQIDDLTVFDSCAGFDGNDPVVDDPAEVWLPYEQQGYYVFARALGKPGKDAEERYIILENESLEAYPLVGNVSSPDEVLLGLGMITQQGAFKADASGQLFRFDGDSDKGKGKSQGVNITDMFLWSGLVFDPALDLNSDGAVNELDAEYQCWGAYDVNANGIIDQPDLDAIGDCNLDTNVDRLDLACEAPCPYDTNNDGVITYDGTLTFDEGGNLIPDCEFEVWLADNKVIGDVVMWEYYEEDWVFTIADLVYLNQVVTNNGIKNLQIRFYPVATTQFDEVPVE